jgi:hypothetical protein
MKVRTKKINGVIFRLGELSWEDAVGQMRHPLPDFKALRSKFKVHGRIISTAGWIAKIGNYYLVISESGSQENIADFTMVPIKPNIKVEKTYVKENNISSPSIVSSRSDSMCS